MKVDKTCRGFNNVDIKDKYGAKFHIRQSSVNMKDVWLGIEVQSEPNERGYWGNKADDSVMSILIDDRVWKQIKKARRLARK